MFNKCDIITINGQIIDNCECKVISKYDVSKHCFI